MVSNFLKFQKSIFKFMLQSKYDNDKVAEYWPTQETAKSTTSSLRTRARTVTTPSLEISEDMTFIIVNINSHPKKTRSGFWVWVSFPYETHTQNPHPVFFSGVNL